MSESPIFLNMTPPVKNLLILCFLLGLLNVYTIMENRELHGVLGQIENGYIDFMSKKHNGVALKESIKPETLGIFIVGKRTIVCAQVVTAGPPPDRPLFSR